MQNYADYVFVQYVECITHTWTSTLNTLELTLNILYLQTIPRQTLSPNMLNVKSVWCFSDSMVMILKAGEIKIEKLKLQSDIEQVTKIWNAYIYCLRFCI